MNYSKLYELIINRAKTRELSGYVEHHHIIPKCLGGTDVKENIVKLTAREHFVAHQLLVMIHKDNKALKYAAYMMTIGPNGRRNNNRLYSWLKEDYYANRIQSSGFTGRKHSEATKAKMREARAKRGPVSQEVRDRISKTKTGVKMSEEARASYIEKRRLNPPKRNPQKSSTKDKIRAANRGRKFPQQVCPHCGKVGSGPNMTRYHLDNCKVLKFSPVAL